jgi:hypothetical protein
MKYTSSLTHMLITIYLRFLLSKLHTEEARVFTSSLYDCLFTDLTYIVTTYVLSAQLLLKTDVSDQLVPTDSLLTDCSGISRSLYKFQISNEKRRFLLVWNVNLAISNWSKVTILNTLNSLVPTYVTLLPLSHPCEPLHASYWVVSMGSRHF